MSLIAAGTAAILDTFIGRLAVLFLAGAAGNPDIAREAARQALLGYHPETDDEYRLAAETLSFSLQALEALGQAAAPDIPMARVLRLRSGAVSLSRASHKAQSRLEALQKARRENTQPQPLPAAPEPRVEKAVALVEDTRKVAAAKTQGQTWTQAYEERQRDLRIAASLKRAEARVAAMAAASTQIPLAATTGQNGQSAMAAPA